ncbi:MAG TPA: hypothetical protein DEP01_07950 [Aminobacterium sp.]|uniref:DUF2179 domain-containing protein n=1 Tax=Aminobacterium TaxID=81466 RepID=UPI000EDECEE5|nr:DUF5698 domain-containing protein [Aminobacterium sp. UBA4834]HCA41406.1 hypothetical protein [Aminobacterium sp.]
MDWLGLILIFSARIADVSLGTVRILFLVRGRRRLAACIGFLEVMIYMSVLGYILGGGGTLTFPQLIAYAAGYGTGNFMGSLLEEKLLNAFVTLDIILERNQETMTLIDRIRAEGFGATVLIGHGKDGLRLVAKVICHRSDIAPISKIIGDQGFVCISDVKGCWGGYFKVKGK